MKRNSKGMLSILVMAILALSFALPFVGVSAVITTIYVDGDAGSQDILVGQTLTISGDPFEVTSGETINVYWDIAGGPDAHLLNTTTGKSDGSFTVEVDVPDAVNGSHYIWVKDPYSTASSAALNVSRKVKLKPSRGLAGDDFTVDGTGFSDDNEITLVFWNTTGVGSYTKTYTETPTTDEYGSFTVELTVPSVLAGVENYGIFSVNASDDVSVLNETATYIVGASILLTPDEGPEGTVIALTGAGFTANDILSVGDIIWDDTHPIKIVGGTITIGTNGKLSGEIVVPSWGEGTYEVNVSDVNNVWANETFKIDGLTSIEVSPTYGSPGATITVKGYNFTRIAGTEVALTLTSTPVSDLVKVDTDADGTFETTFISPAVTFDTYKVYANDTVYDVDAADTFKVGIIAFIINPTHGEAGTKVALTGIGFSDGPYNVTFGDELYADYGTEVVSEAISDYFYVPNVEPGVYDLTVIDIKENELTVQFTVTESTYVSMDPPLAPNDYNVTIKGYNFADVAGEVEFILYNSTDEWELTVWKNATSTIKVKTNDDGNFTGLWEVLPEDDISLGDYTVNITGSEGLLVQVPFSVVEARVSVAPRKAQFDRGDSIQFNIKNDFKLPDAYIEIYDPSDTLYWSTEEFEDGWWLLVEGLYTVPYYRQTAALNPMELQNDAPMGAWLYIFYDNKDDQLMNGTFAVGPSTAAQVDEKLTEMWGSIEDLTSNIDDITSEIGDDIDALSGEIDDVVADVQDMIDDITADLAGELAQVAEDTEAAVSDIRDDIGDLAGAQADLASELESISQDTTDAKVAAEEAQSSAQGLTTLVYGAIGASLIAALAAIVSLMQISKKIA